MFIPFAYTAPCNWGRFGHFYSSRHSSKRLCFIYVLPRSGATYSRTALLLLTDSRESELYSSRNRLQYRVGICSFPWSVGIYLSWPATAQRGGAASSRLRLRLYSHTRSTVSCMVPDRCSAEALGAGQQAAAKPFRRAAYTFTRRHHDTALRLHARLKREPGPARSPTNS